MATNIPGSFRPQNAFEVFTRVAPSLVDAQGRWTPFAAAAQLYDQVEIRTTATPPIVLDVASVDSPGINPVTAALKPTVILRGPLGQRVIAPHGVAGESVGAVVSIGAAVGVGVLLGGLGFLLGRRRRR